MECKVSGKQYVDRTFTSFRARFNNYWSSSKKLSSWISVTQAELFKYYTEVNHHGFLEDVSFHIMDRLFGVSRHKQGFWHFKLKSVDSASILLSFIRPALFASIICSLASSFAFVFTTSALLQLIFFVLCH